MGKNQHVVPNGSGWSVKGAGNSKATKNFDTKQQAIAFGRQTARNQGSELVVHNKDGRISQKDSHGNDKFPPKG